MGNTSTAVAQHDQYVVIVKNAQQVSVEHPITIGQRNKIVIRPGDQAAVVSKDIEEKVKNLPNVLAKKKGSDLELLYADGHEIVFQDYFATCKDGNSCSVVVAGSSSDGYIIPASATKGLESGDGSQVVYAYGDKAVMQGMTKAEPALLPVFEGSSSQQISYISGQSIHGGILAGGALGSALALGGGGGGGSVAAAVVADNFVKISLLAGPVVENNGLTVYLYRADGTLLGSAPLKGDGTVEINVGSYSGVVVAKVIDTSDGPDFVAEATGLAVDLNANLMSIGVAQQGTLQLNVNPLTTIAAIKAGVQFESSTLPALTTQSVNQINQAIADTFGITSLTDTIVTPTVTNTGASNSQFTPDQLSAAEKYGAVLAALSGMDKVNNGNMQTSIEQLANQIAVNTTSGKATLSDSAIKDMTAGAYQVALQNGTTQSLNLTSIISDLTTQSGNSGLTITAIGTGTALGLGQNNVQVTGTVSGANNVSLAIAQHTRQATVENNSWHYTLTADDLTALGSGTAIVTASATLADNSILTAKRSVVLDLIAPTLTISSDKPALKIGETAAITFTFSEAPIGFESNDIVTTGGVLSSITATQDSKIYTATFTPAINSSTSASISVAKSVYTDAVGNNGRANAMLAINVDTIAPTVAINTSISNGYVNDSEDENSLAISGTASGADGQTVTVNIGGTSKTATVSGDAWTVTLASNEVKALAEGSIAISADVKDAAGNSATQATASFNYDRTSPTTTISGISFSNDTGTSSTDLITKTAGQTISATLSANLAAGEVLYGSLDNGTTWVDITNKVTNTAVIWDGVTLTSSNILKFKVTDAAGNAGVVASQAYVLDNSAPTSSISGISFSNDTGTSSTDLITKTAGQTISATLSANLAAGEILYGSLDNGTTWVDITNKVTNTAVTWDGVTLTSSNTLKFKVTDAAGNDGSVASQAYVLDSNAPTSTISGISFSNDTGTSSTDLITKTAGQTISATLSANLAAGEVLYGSLDNGTTWVDITNKVTNTALSWDGVTLTGSNTLKLKVTDAAGNDGVVTGQTYVLDSIAPTTTLSGMSFSNDTGISNTDFITNSGIAVPLQTNLYATPLVYNIDRIVGSYGRVSGSIKTDGTFGTLNQSNILDWNLTLNADSNLATVGYLLGPQSGNTSFLNIFPASGLTASMSNGISSLSVKFGTPSHETFQIATDTPSSQYAYKVVWQIHPSNDMQDEVVQELHGYYNPPSYQSIAVIQMHSSGTQTLGTTTTFGETISATLSATLGAGEKLYGSLDNGNTWIDITNKVTNTALSWNDVILVGNNTLKLKVTDAAGNDSAISNQAYVVDTTAPSTTVSSIGLSNDTGMSSTDFMTKTASQTISATLSANLAAGEALYGSLDNGTTWVDITNKVTNTALSWSGVTLTASNTLKFKVTDAAGNDGTIASQAYVLDNSAPTSTISGISFSNDTGTSSSDFLTKTASQTISATLSANLAAGEVLYGSLDNGATWVDISNKVINTALSWTGVTLTASNTLKLKVTDAAGNDGVVASQAYVLDNSAPTTTVSGISLSNDTGTSSSDFLTKTASQTISATLSANLAAGEVLYGSLDNGTTWVDITNKVTNTVVSWNGVTLTGSNSLKLKVTDTAGNDGSVASQAYVLDNSAPTTTVSGISFSSDTGVSNTDFVTSTGILALPLVYSINRNVGGFGSVTGNIKTDGTMGTLSQNNILDWNLTLNADANSATLGHLFGPQSGNNSYLNFFPATAITTSMSNGVSSLLINIGTLEVFQIANATPSSGRPMDFVWQIFRDELVQELDSISNPPSYRPIQLIQSYGSGVQTLGTTTSIGQTISATLSSTLAAGEKLYGSLDNGNTWIDISNKVTNTTLSWNDVILTGNNTLKLKVTDAAGNDSAVSSQLYVVDSTAPTLTSSSPTDNAIGFAVSDNITLTFSEAVYKGAGNIVIRNVTDNTDAFTLNVSSASEITGWGTNTLTINPSSNLAENKNYAVKVAGNSIVDNAGNAYAGITDNTSLDFTTVDSTKVFFDLVSGKSSAHSGRTFSANVTDIYLMVDSNASTATLPSGSKWLSAESLSANVMIHLISSGSAIHGNGGGANQITQVAKSSNEAKWLSNNVNSVAKLSKSGVFHRYAMSAHTADLFNGAKLFANANFVYEQAAGYGIVIPTTLS